MSYVGRLIFPSRVVIRRLDTSAIQAAGRYDPILREIRKVDTNSDGIGDTGRIESAEEVILGQVATRSFEEGREAESGLSPQTRNLEVTFHFKDLQAAGLIQADGRAKIEVGVRLVRIENKSGTEKIVEFPNPPGMFLFAARPSGFLGASRNLWVCTFSERQAAHPEPRASQV